VAAIQAGLERLLFLEQNADDQPRRKPDHPIDGHAVAMGKWDEIADQRVNEEYGAPHSELNLADPLSHEAETHETQQRVRAYDESLERMV